LLIKQFIATISVDPGSGGANQDLRRSFLLHQSLAKQSSSVDAAVANSPLCFLRPVLRDVLASEVDDRVPLSTIAERNLITVRAPRWLAGIRRFPSCQWSHPMPTLNEMRSQVTADQSRRACHQDVQAIPFAAQRCFSFGKSKFLVMGGPTLAEGMGTGGYVWATWLFLR